MTSNNQNPSGFKTDKLQIGNLQDSVTQSQDGSLFFKDKFIPQGIRLKDFDTSTHVYYYDELLAITGSIQNDLNDLQQQIDGVYVDPRLNPITAFLQSEITNDYNTLKHISGYFYNEITNNYTILQTVSGNLQEQITNDYESFISSFNTLESQIVSISSSFMTGLIASSGYLQEQITSNRNDFAAISGILQAPLTIIKNNIDIPLAAMSGQIEFQKMDKVSEGVPGHLIMIDITGNAVDSGKYANSAMISYLSYVTVNDSAWQVLDQTRCDSTINTIEWQLFAINNDDPSLKYASRIMALYSCSALDWTEYAILSIGGQTKVPVRVVYNDPYIELQVKGTSTLNINSSRILSYEDYKEIIFYSLDFSQFKNSQYVALL